MLIDFNILKHRLLYGGSTTLRTIEIKCLKAYADSLPQLQQEIAKSHISLIEVVHRQQQGKLILFRYLSKRCRSILERAPNQTCDLGAGVIFLSYNKKKLKCQVIFDDGLLSALLFSKSILGNEDMNWQISSVQITADISQSVNHAPDAFAPSSEILSRLASSFTLTNILPPPSKDDINNLQAKLDFVLPPDIQLLLNETNGFSIDEWRFYGTNPRFIPSSDYNLVAFAETQSEDQAICYRDGTIGGMLLLYNQVDNLITNLSNSFIDELLAATSKESDT